MSVTHDFKFEAPDGKQRASDALATQLAHAPVIEDGHLLIEEAFGGVRDSY